jgi:hypothetical protein
MAVKVAIAITLIESLYGQGSGSEVKAADSIGWEIGTKTMITVTTNARRQRSKPRGSHRMYWNINKNLGPIDGLYGGDCSGVASVSRSAIFRNHAPISLARRASASFTNPRNSSS